MTTPETINLISSGIQAITTVVLSIITYKQMVLGRKSIDSMERSIKADFLPILVLGLAAYNSNDKILNIELTNCGKGLARKPKIIFPGQPDITLNSIDVGKKDNAIIEYKMEYVLSKVDLKDRKIVIEYHDVFDRKVITEANLIEVKFFGPDSKQPGIGWESWTPIIP